MKSWLHKANSNKCCCPKCRNGENVVRSGLSYTVSEMAAAAASGRPVSLNNCALTPSQGQVNPSWDVPLERKRGVDIADIYQAQQAARNKVRSAGLESRKKAKEAQQSNSD